MIFINYIYYPLIRLNTLMNIFCPFNIVFELLERGEVLTVPTDTPLNEKTAWLAFRDVVLGLEYRK